MPFNSRPPRKIGGDELLNYALNLLSGRALSASEVRAKLTRKAADPEEIPAILTKLRESGFLDDDRFAEGFATARRDSRGMGKARVLRDLRQRRVSSTVAEKAVQQAYEEVDEAAMITQWIERKLRNADLKDEKQLASAYRKLRYAGFSSGASIRVLKQFSARADELEDAEDDS